jgi:hypothetical protein
MRRHHSEHPALITTAPQNSDDEFDRRRKRYAVMMALRAVCVLAAALSYRVSIVAAVVFLVGGAVLPWCAVIIANDRPPKRRTERVGYGAGPAERALPAGDDGRTVNADAGDAGPENDPPGCPAPDGRTFNGPAPDGRTSDGCAQEGGTPEDRHRGAERPGRHLPPAVPGGTIDA